MSDYNNRPSRRQSFVIAVAVLAAIVLVLAVGP